MSIDSISFTTDAGTSTIARTVHVDSFVAEEPRFDLGPSSTETLPAATIRRELAELVEPPPDDDFAENETDFLEDIHMENLGRQLIRDWPELRHIRNVSVAYAWKRKGGKSKGALVFGTCTKLSGYARYRSQADFLIWLAADHVRDAAFTPEQLEALLYHELKHIGFELDEDENSPTYGEMQIKAVGHDVEGFYDEIRRYGSWRDSLRHAEHEFKQLALVAEEVQ